LSRYNSGWFCHSAHPSRAAALLPGPRRALVQPRRARPPHDATVTSRSRRGRVTGAFPRAPSGSSHRTRPRAPHSRTHAPAPLHRIRATTPDPADADAWTRPVSEKKENDAAGPRGGEGEGAAQPDEKKERERAQPRKEKEPAHGRIKPSHSFTRSQPVHPSRPTEPQAELPL
jgi:hypothetical protein